MKLFTLSLVTCSSLLLMTTSLYAQGSSTLDTVISDTKNATSNIGQSAADAGQSALDAASDAGTLISVNLENILRDVAVDLNVDESNIPITIQIPINVAANVCDVSVNALAVQVDAGDANCVAVTGSQEVSQVVEQQMAASGAASSGGSNSESTQPESPAAEPTESSSQTSAADTQAADTSADADASKAAEPATTK